MLQEQPWQADPTECEHEKADVPGFVRDDRFLGLGDTVFPEIINALDETMSGGYDEAVLCWGIGSGKSFFASLALCYMVHSLLCLRDPQAALGLAPGSNITLITMAPSARQARHIVFGEISKLAEGSPWFQEHAAGTQYLAQEVRFPKDIVLVAGNSSTTFALGYNVLGLVIDEAAFFPWTAGGREESVEDIYHALKHRMSSRFTNRGLVVLISSPRVPGDFMDRRLAACGADPKCYGSRKTVWEVRPEHLFSGERFTLGDLEIPVEYKRDFDLNPQRALRDLAARPVRGLTSFFPDATQLDACVDETLQHPLDAVGRLCDWLAPQTDQPRYVHIDLGLTRDACGLAMASCLDDDDHPGACKAVVELMLQLCAPAGGEVDLSRPREIVLALRERGFNVAQVSYDGWQSADSRQILKRRGIQTKLVSVDRTPEAYETLKELVLDGRLAIYRHEVFLAEAKRLEIVDGRKVDHPPGGSKDVADAVAGAVSEAVKNWGGSQLRARVI